MNQKQFQKLSITSMLARFIEEINTHVSTHVQTQKQKQQAIRD